VIGLIILLIVLGCAQQEGVTVEFRLAQPEPAEGLTLVVLAASGESFYLHDEVLLSNADIECASPGSWDGRPTVALTFTEAGREKFAQLTEENVGGRVGILLDGELVTAPVIRAPIYEGKAVINGNFTEQEAKRIAAGIIRHREK
jgi:preprotein translocase subunit SecD